MKFRLGTSKIISLLKKSASSLFFVAIIITLWSIAIWDISKILDEYINDNKYTYVKSNEISNDNVVPFLEDMEFCVRYKNNIFEQRFFTNINNTNMNSSNKTDDYFVDWSTNLLTINEFINNINYSKISTENGILSLNKKEIIFIAKYLYQIQILDDRFLNVAIKNLSVFDDGNSTIVQAQLTNKKRLETLEKTFHRWIKSANFDTYPYAYVSSFSSTQICYYYKLRDAFAAQAKNNPNNNKLILPLGIIHTNKDAAKKALSKTVISTTEAYPINNLFDIGDGPTWPSAFETRISVKNIGVYDKTEVSSDNCYTDDENLSVLPLKQSGTNYWPNCKSRIYVRAMYEFCSCIPFTLRTLIKNDGDDTKPFCTYEIYNSSCFNQVKNNVSRMPCFDQCVTIKNQYKFDRYFINDYPGGDTNDSSNGNGLNRLETNGIFTQTRITVIIDDNAYSVYQEKFQFSLAQLVAQVGGDIGLYTGFSMMALWQFIVYLYNHHRKYIKRRKEKQIRNQRTLVAEKDDEFTESYFEAIMCYLETRGCKYDKNETAIKENLQMEFEEMKENLRKLQNELIKTNGDLRNERLQRENVQKELEEMRKDFKAIDRVRDNISDSGKTD